METLLDLTDMTFCFDGFPPLPRAGKHYKTFSLTRTQFTARSRKLCLIEFGHSPDQTIETFKDVDKDLTSKMDHDAIEFPNFGVGVEGQDDVQVGHFWSFGHDEEVFCHAIEWECCEVVSESFEVMIPPGKIFGKTDKFLSSIQKGN